MGSFRDLLVWQNSVDLVTNIYILTRDFPKEEVFGLTSQIRRASVSISSNIAEGSSFRSDKKFNHFINIALGSCYELEIQLTICRNLIFITPEQYNEIISKLITIQKS